MSSERKNATGQTAENPMGSAVNDKHENTALVAPPESSEPMTLEQVRKALKASKGKKYWRSLDELANTPEFQAAVEREFPSAAQEWVDPVSRRGFLKLMGASMALHQAARRAHLSLHQSAGRSGPRQADVLCYGASVCDRRGAAAGQERRVPAYQN
jgi:MoCo/4Fe-4S cofactor protein with predicted Tat translocation signal